MQNALVLALTASGLAAGILLGIFVAFRGVTRDAALIGALDKRVAQALTLSSDAKARADLLTATWEEHLADLERKRAKAAAERQRAEQVQRKQEAAEPAEPVDPQAALDALSPRERRRALARIRGVA
mgnify:CR=1 FL=1